MVGFRSAATILEMGLLILLWALLSPVVPCHSVDLGQSRPELGRIFTPLTAPPSADIDATSDPSADVRQNAISLPSGDHVGVRSVVPGSLVSCRGGPLSTYFT